MCATVVSYVTSQVLSFKLRGVSPSNTLTPFIILSVWVTHAGNLLGFDLLADS